MNKINIFFIINMLFLWHFTIIAEEIRTRDSTISDKRNNNAVDSKANQTSIGNEIEEKTNYHQESKNINKKKNLNISVSAGINLIRGYTTYQIGGWVDSPEGSGYTRFPLSELIFPLDIYMANLKASMEFAEKWKIDTGIKKNINEEAGKMKDSDWGINYYEIPWWTNPNSLDIYSESDAKLNAWIADISIAYDLNNIKHGNFEWLFFIGIKYIYQNFDFDVYNADQWYPSLNEYYGYDIEHDILQGKVMTYEIITHIPSATAGIELKYANKCSFETTIGYSPFVKLEDKDNHILRSKISKAKCEGDAILFSIAGRFYIYTPWFIQLQFDYISIETKGKQKQYNEGVWLGTIDQKNFSQRKSVEFSVGYIF